MKKVVVNALQNKQNSSGIGVMIRELFSAYTHLTDRECRVICTRDGREFNGGPRTEIVRTEIGDHENLRRVLFLSFGMGLKYCQNSILLTTDAQVPLLLPTSCFLAPVVTDLAVFRMRSVYRISRVLLWRLQYAYLRRRANVFLTISEFTKREMVEILKIPAEKIHVVPCAASFALSEPPDDAAKRALRKKYNLPEHFVLFVGNSNPRKNLRRLMQAFDQVKRCTALPHQLIIAGDKGWLFNREQELSALEHAADMRFIGFVPEADMPALYAAADMFAFPTLYEGFGIPVIEAQLCGTPVLAASGSALEEVGGDGALYADPYSVDSIAENMLRILDDASLAAALRERGWENAARFTWKGSAQLLNDVLERALEDTSAPVSAAIEEG